MQTEFVFAGKCNIMSFYSCITDDVDKFIEKDCESSFEKERVQQIQHTLKIKKH